MPCKSRATLRAHRPPSATCLVACAGEVELVVVVAIFVIVLKVVWWYNLSTLQSARQEGRKLHDLVVHELLSDPELKHVTLQQLCIRGTTEIARIHARR